MSKREHRFNDGENVRLKATGEIVTIESWWFASNMPTWPAQYHIVEYPVAWFSESELESLPESTKKPPNNKT